MNSHIHDNATVDETAMSLAGVRLTDHDHSQQDVDFVLPL